ncbi:MAG: ribonuclease Z [Anaerolineae bacterium]|nr:ribonuclease Z [Anaerolineae bacterium]
MFEIVFLGTSASAPSVDRGLSATLVLFRDQRFLIDCGEGTQRQLLRSGFGFRKLDKVLLTHGHLDHILGLGGLVSTFSRWEAIDTVSIYGGRWALQRVEDLMKVVLRSDEVDMNIDFLPIRPGIIWSNDAMTISAFPVSHRGPGCFGFIFEERGRRPFLVEKAEALGVPRGPERRRLVAGESISLPDGTIIHPEQVLGEEVKGTKIVHVGDAGRTDNLVEVCQDADALIIEATYTSFEEEMALRFGHLTAAQAAELAAAANVKHLFLVHLSRRYSDRQIAREAEEIMPHTHVPRDLDHYRIVRGSALKIGGAESAIGSGQ